MIIKFIPVEFQQKFCMEPERRYFGGEVDCHLTSPHFMGVILSIQRQSRVLGATSKHQPGLTGENRAAVVLKISVKSMSISNSGSVMLGDPALISIYWRYCKSP